ncbi:MAG: FkbM family methyltransferase [Vicinamibacterales bacterium]
MLSIDPSLSAPVVSPINRRSRHFVVLVATYNRLALLQRVLKAIEDGTRAEHEVVVIDGGSTDGTIEFLESHPTVTPVFQGELLGTARCYNRVWRHIDSTYSCWLSDDTEIVPGSLDLALEILEGDPEVGMVGLKMRDTLGPGKGEPYRGGISEFGILNCNHGVLRTKLARSFGFFNEQYRSYMIDPDLTASVLCSGKTVVMTRAVSVLHHREWAEKEGESKVVREMGGIDNDQIYREKFGMLEASRTLGARLRTWTMWTMGRALFYKAPGTARRFWLNRRDWYNLSFGRFIRVTDPLIYRGKPYHLVQRLPERYWWSSAAEMPRTAADRVKLAMRRQLGDSSWFLLSRVKRGAYRWFERPLMALVNRLPARVRLSLRSQTRLLRRLDYPKAEIVIHADSEQEFWRRANSCTKEPEMAAWIEGTFRPGDVFYDVGANIGAYSLVAAKAFQGQVRVYAFEPAAFNYAQLCRNVYVNAVSDCVSPMPVALSDRTVLDWFNYATITAGGAFHAFGAPLDYTGQAFEPVFRQPVISYRIDDLVELFGVPAPTHLKIDVDGIEFQVLKGADRVLHHVRSVMLELNRRDASADDVARYLAEKGLTLHSRSERAHDVGDPESPAANCLFVRTDG